jgi:SWI/SNF-related matrix-associated actin-dependent regulator 1 of chromatin subfamily A
MPTPLPTQLSGAKFLADRKYALLADEPRVGKTGAAVIAADYILAEKILVVTTASGRPVWRRGLPEWSKFPRPVQVLTNGVKLDKNIPSAIVGWPSLVNPEMRATLMNRQWDLVIGDEEHYARNFESKRTQAFYGELTDDGRALNRRVSIAGHGTAVWPLTGTPMPNSPFDYYPRLRALAPERLYANSANGWPDVTKQSDFKKRYCVTRPMKIGRGGYKRFVDIVVSGRNEEELRARIGDFMMLRTQQDVGIGAPIYELLPLMVDERLRRNIDGNDDAEMILAAAELDDTKKLELHLGPLRRLTGEIKAHAVVEAVKDEFECGLDKIVLMRWHDKVGEIIRAGLEKYGVVTVDGKTSNRDREIAEQRFKNDPSVRVFDGQIQAAGEAIDLSAAALLIFVETSFIPKDMKQASLRITNHTQTRQAVVRVAVLEGSIDEAAQNILLRKWSSIGKVLKQ